MVQPKDEKHDVYPAIDPSTALKGAASGFHVGITGASRGCGRAMAVAFAQAGASKLFLFGRDEKTLAPTAELAEKAGSNCKVFCYSLDLSKDKLDAPFAKMLKDADGKLDVFINNAGVLEEWKPINDSDPVEWWLTYEVNIRGVYLATKAILPTMLKNSGGTIINLGSTGAMSTRPGASSYQSCKSALVRFTAFLDVDHGKQGIRTFAIHPGGVKTELGLNMPQWMHEYLIDTPELSAAVCVYLTTPEADYLRGRYVSSNWDLPALLTRKDEVQDKNLFKLVLNV